MCFYFGERGCVRVVDDFWQEVFTLQFVRTDLSQTFTTVMDEMICETQVCSTLTENLKKEVLFSLKAHFYYIRFLHLVMKTIEFCILWF